MKTVCGQLPLRSRAFFDTVLVAGGDSMSDIREWLAARGFERFADVFEENEVDLEALPELTDADLKEMGLALGPRVKLRKAIAALRGG
jgi:hypothetical protein